PSIFSPPRLPSPAAEGVAAGEKSGSPQPENVTAHVEPKRRTASQLFPKRFGSKGSFRRGIQLNARARLAAGVPHGLPLPPLFFPPPRQPLLGVVAVAHPQRHRLAQGPAQVSVADLLLPEAALLACRFVIGTDQPRVGQKSAYVTKTTDIVDLVKQHQGQDLA